MKLEVTATRASDEICHYYGDDLTICSRHRQIHVTRGRGETSINMPRCRLDVFGGNRLARRALRLDKCNVTPVGGDKENLVIFRQGRAYHYDAFDGVLLETLVLKNCRNMLHQSVAVIDDGRTIFFGEYGNNPDRKSVPVYRSDDYGRSWEVVHSFDAGTAKHVHGCYWDPYEEKLWVLTGDFDGECHMVVADRDFRSCDSLGDGGQLYRACNVFFEQDQVVWIMDSPLEDSHVISYRRSSGQIEKGQVFPGPVWYIKRLVDGHYLAATASETGPGVRDNYAHLMYSTDLSIWHEIARFPHDGLPRGYFKSGVIGFADGVQSSDDFVIFGEALIGLDGSVKQCRLESV